MAEQVSHHLSALLWSNLRLNGVNLEYQTVLSALTLDLLPAHMTR